MLFRNPVLLAGLAGVLIPVILHLIRRQAAKPYDWGAMRFLFDTVAARRRRMEWEDFLLMIARCLLIALIVLAIARPFVPPNSGIPWLFVLPLGLLGVIRHSPLDGKTSLQKSNSLSPILATPPRLTILHSSRYGEVPSGHKPPLAPLSPTKLEQSFSPSKLSFDADPRTLHAARLTPYNLSWPQRTNQFRPS
ncbi:BatA domain-containing protein [Akkermansiaceae bacterium]|nr:BatA domain-containing protein [Akkermansiaceae bacterium]